MNMYKKILAGTFLAAGWAIYAGIIGQVFPFLVACICAGAFLDSFRMLYWRRRGWAFLTDVARHLVTVPVFWIGLYFPCRALTLALWRARGWGPLPPLPQLEICGAACGLLVGVAGFVAVGRMRRGTGGSGLQPAIAGAGPAVVPLQVNRGLEAPPTLASLVAADASNLAPDFVRQRVRVGTAALWVALSAGLLAWEVPRLDPANWTDEEVRQYALLPVKKAYFLSQLGNRGADVHEQFAAVQVLLGVASDDATVRAAVKAKLLKWFREGSADDQMKAVSYLQSMADGDTAVAQYRKGKGQVDFDNFGKCEAAAILVKLTLGDESGSLAPDFVRALRHPYEDVRAFAATALGATGADPAVAVPALREALKDKAYDVRLQAVKGLALLGRAARDAEPDLRAALRDPGWGTIRQEAAAALIKLAPDAGTAVATLQEVLRNDDVGTRTRAVQAAPAIGAPAVPALVATLKDSDKSVRWAAIEALGKIGPPAAPAVGDLLLRVKPYASDESWEDRNTRATAVPALARIGLPLVIDRLADPDPEVGRRAAGALLYLIKEKPVEGAPPLIEALHHPNAVVRLQIVKVLGRIWPPHAWDVLPAVIQALASAAADADPDVRFQAALARWKVDEKAPAPPVPILVAAMSDEDQGVRARAVLALATAGAEAKAAVPALAAALRDPYWAVAARAIEALRGLKSEARAAVPVLQELIRDEKAYNRVALVAALPDIADPAEAADTLIGLFTKREFRGTAAGQLGRLPSDVVGPRLASALGRPDVRSFAIEALADSYDFKGLADGEAGPIAAELTRALSEVKGEAFTRPYAARSLGRMGPRAAPAVPALVEALSDADAGMRREAADALGMMAHAARAAVPSLAGLVKDGDQSVRLAAIDALGALGQEAKAAAGTLAEALKDKEDHLRLRAAQALGRLGRAASEAVPALAAALKDRKTQAYDGVVPFRGVVAQALAQIGPAARDAVPALMEAAEDPEGYVRGPAVDALGAIGPEARAAVPVLIRHLMERDPTIGAKAAQALRSIGKDAAAAVPELVRAFGDRDGNLSVEAAYALAALGPEARTATPVLLENLRRGSNLAFTVMVLEAIGPDAAAAAPELEKLLKQNLDPRFRNQVQRALPKIRR